MQAASHDRNDVLHTVTATSEERAAFAKITQAPLQPCNSQQILNIVKSSSYCNQAIMNAITCLQGSSASAGSVNNLQTTVNNLQGNVTELSEKIDALSNGTGGFKILGPFSVQPTADKFANLLGR